MHLVLLNGPPRAGKDTAARAICEAFPNTATLRFSEPLKRAAHALFGLPADTLVDAFEAVKDVPCADFHGFTPRQVYIMLSERGVAPVFGQPHFGRVMATNLRRAERAGVQLAVVPDSGFSREVGPVLAELHPSRVLLIRVHADARGCNFDRDSRSFITVPEVVTLDIANDLAGDPEPFRCEVVRQVQAWRAGRLTRMVAA